MHETADDLVSRCKRCSTRATNARGSTSGGSRRPNAALDAAQVTERLVGMTLLVLATVTADGRPLNGPVDGVFYRGSFYFGSAPDSVRFRHIRQAPVGERDAPPGGGARGDGARPGGADRRAGPEPVAASAGRCSTSTSRATAPSGSSSSTPASRTRASTPSACSRSPCRPKRRKRLSRRGACCGRRWPTTTR